jgi:hypothetical protein
MMKNRFAVLLLLLLSLLSLPNHLSAEEGGVGHYVPGSLSTLIDLPPTEPGWIGMASYLNYQGEVSVDRTIAIAGLLTANLDATSDAALVGAVYTFENPLAGAWYSVGAYIPWVWMDVEASIASPAGPSRTRRDRENGLGDITLIPLMMAWKSESWQFSTVLPIYAPTGDYEVGRLANPGLNYWTFDPTIGLSYSNDQTGFNAAVYTGFAINTENDDTDYRSGTAWHTELSAQQLLPAGPGFLGLGFNAWYYQQVSGDSGAGATLGDFKGRSAGIGPALTYVLPIGDNTLVGEIRWMPELDTRRRLEGDYIWVKLAFVF